MYKLGGENGILVDETKSNAGGRHFLSNNSDYTETSSMNFFSSKIELEKLKVPYPKGFKKSQEFVHDFASSTHPNDFQMIGLRTLKLQIETKETGTGKIVSESSEHARLGSPDGRNTGRDGRRRQEHEQANKRELELRWKRILTEKEEPRESTLGYRCLKEHKPLNWARAKWRSDYLSIALALIH